MRSLHNDLCRFMAVYRRILLKMRNMSDKDIDNIKAQILLSVTFLRKSRRLWVNVEKYDTTRQATGDNIIRRMHFLCWITKTTGTHTLTAFEREHWLRERS
jgi:hypothetical protein